VRRGAVHENCAGYSYSLILKILRFFKHSGGNICGNAYICSFSRLLVSCESGMNLGRDVREKKR